MRDKKLGRVRWHSRRFLVVRREKKNHRDCLGNIERRSGLREIIIFSFS